MSQIVQNTSSRSNLRPVLWAVPLAGVVSATVNMLIWFLLRGDFDLIRVGQPGQEMPFWSGAVILFSLVGALGAGIVYALISRFIRNPNQVFLWVAIAVLVLSFSMLFSIKNPPLSVVIGLELMHVVVFCFMLWFVPRRHEPST